MNTRFILTLSFLFSTCLLLAQPNKTYSIKDKKAIKKYEEALTAYSQYNYDLSTLILKEMCADYSNFAEPFFLLAQIYVEQNKSKEAIPYLEKGTAINAKIFPLAFFMLAECCFNAGEYEKAELAVTSYIRNPVNDQQVFARATLILESAVFAQESLKYPVPFNPVNLGEKINSKNNEYYPAISADGKTLLYTRLVPTKDAFDGKQEDFFLAKRNDPKALMNNWEQSQPVAEINTILNEGAPTLSADGQTIIFTACELYGEWGENRTGVGSCDLFYSMLTTKGWSQTENLGNTINTGSWETQPSLTADGSTLYFVRGKRVNGKPIENQDIYYSQINEYGEWSTPKKIPGKVNTQGKEESVFVHPDGKTLYFSSNGHPGMGGSDIYMSTLNADGTWGTPKNLGYPINTHGDENSIQVTADGSIALIASDRDGGFGGLDLYAFELTENNRPHFVTYVEGYVYDSKTNEPLQASLQLIDVETGDLVADAVSNPSKDGYFLVCLPTGADYALNVNNPNYLFYSSNFSLKEYTSGEPFRKDAPLSKMVSGAEIVLENIFFATNSYALEPESSVELTKLVELLNRNPQLRIRIEGHTDSDGDEAKNLTLSKNRAASVTTYLIGKGIASDRLESEGFGESKPIAPNDNSVNKAKNRRTAFRVL
ncbi:MAG: OmpA family protein [Bacteroidota bacterium]